jgi:hypothetical protein
MFWCLGMYSSASTWTFNVVQQIAGSIDPARAVTPVFGYDALPDCDESSTTLVIKTHAAGIAEELGRRAQGIVITIRDPRDAIASLMRHNKAPFDLALRVTEASAWTCARFAAHPRAALLRFEDRFFDDPRTVQCIASLFPGTLPAADSQRIFERLRRNSVDAFIAGLETMPTSERHFDEQTGEWDAYDPATGWHKHHAGRNAEIGRWRRELSDLQALTIARRLRPWMQRFGYSPSTPQPQPPYALSVGRYEFVG